MSSKVAVEKTGIGITKLISSLRLQQSIYGGIYTKQGMRTDHVCTCLVTLRVDNESYPKTKIRRSLKIRVSSQKTANRERGGDRGRGWDGQRV